MEIGRRTREEVVKWNQVTVLRFQTGGDQVKPKQSAYFANMLK